MQKIFSYPTTFTAETVIFINPLYLILHPMRVSTWRRGKRIGVNIVEREMVGGELRIRGVHRLTKQPIYVRLLTKTGAGVFWYP